MDYTTSESHETIFEVTGMKCDGCAGTIEGALKGVAGVEGVAVERFSTPASPGRLRVRHHDAADVVGIAKAIGAAGYPAHVAPHGEAAR
jgi:copper chaperone CopZ